MRAAEWFVGLFQAGADVFISWMGSIVPLVLMLGLVATQGLAQGSLDATLMPVLRSHIDERYSATGYGLLNLTSAGVGALISFFGGWFKDQGVPLTTTLAAVLGFRPPSSTAST